MRKKYFKMPDEWKDRHVKRNYERVFRIILTRHDSGLPMSKRAEALERALNTESRRLRTAERVHDVNTLT